LKFCHAKVGPATRNIVIGRLQAGQSQNEVARTLNVNQSTTSRQWNRFQQTGSSNDRPRSGRPRITIPGQHRYIRVLHLRNRTVSASTTAVGIPGLRRISSQTVRNRLRQHGIRPKRPYLRAVLTPLHRRERVLWCNRLSQFCPILVGNALSGSVYAHNHRLPVEVVFLRVLIRVRPV
jgi:transposase